jgi:tetratricopeptide (TPR) repeat protein
VPLLLLLFLAVSPATSAATPTPAEACTRGEALANLGRLGSAEAAYLEDLKTKEGIECAPDKLAELGTRISECARARALSEAGQKAEAEKAYEKVLEAEPKSECAKTGLTNVGGKSDRENLESLSSKLGSILLAAILPVAIALFLLFTLLFGLARFPWTRNSRFILWLLSPTIKIGEFDATWMAHGLGPQFTSLVRTELNPEPSGSLRMVTGHSGSKEALEALNGISEAKGVVAILSFFIDLLRRSYEVGGALQPPGDKDAGVTVELTRDKGAVVEVALWNRDFEGPAGEDAKAMQALAVPAAAWVEHEIAAQLGKVGDLQSTDAQSWAFFRAGLAAQRKSLSDQAANLYLRALEIDPENGGALANLGLIRLNEHRNEKAEELLKRAITSIATKTNSQFSPDLLRARLNLAATYGNWGAEEKDETKKAEKIGQARTEVCSLVAAVRDIERNEPPPEGSSLAVLLERITLAAIAIYAWTKPRSRVPSSSTQLDANLLQSLEEEKLAAGEAIAYLRRAEDLPPTVAYNLVCAEVHNEEEPEATARLLDLLENVPTSTRRTLAKGALTDPTLKPLRCGAGGIKLTRKLKAWAKPPPKPAATK